MSAPAPAARSAVFPVRSARRGGFARRVVGGLAAVALAAPLLPLAPAALAYDEICIRHRAAYSAKIDLNFFRERRPPDYADRDDAADFQTGDRLRALRLTSADYGWRQRLGNWDIGSPGEYCWKAAELGRPAPGEPFSLDIHAVGGKKAVCQLHPDLRNADGGGEWLRVFAWPDAGAGKLYFRFWGTTLHPRCEAQGRGVMWGGCAEGREGFRRSACYPWRPSAAGTAAYDFAADESKSVAYLASVARRGANLNAAKNGETPLHAAVRLNRTDHVRVLLGQGPHLNPEAAPANADPRNADGDTPLMTAIKTHGDAALLPTEALLAAGANPRLSDRAGIYLPHLAASRAAGQSARALMRAIGDAPADFRLTEFVRAFPDSEAGTLLLLRLGADPNWLDLDADGQHSAAHVAAAHSLAALRAMFDPAAPRRATANLQDAPGRSLLHWAMTGEPANGARRDIVELLLQNGADPNRRDLAGQTPLHYAARHGRAAAIAPLLESGADQALRDRDGNTPLQLAEEPRARAALLNTETPSVDAVIAVVRQRPDDTEELTRLMWRGKNSPDPNRRNDDGHTALHVAAQVSYAALRELFYPDPDSPFAADPNRQDIHGHPVIYWAISGRPKNGAREGIIEFLLEQGADPNLQNQNGQAALHQAARYGRPEHFAVLLNYGADPALRDNEGRTPMDVAKTEATAAALANLLADDQNFGAAGLARAARQGDLNELQRLLRHGADINAPGPDGRAPIHWAVASNDRAMFQFLIANGADPARPAGRGRDEGATPFALALRDENYPMLAELLAAGLDPRADAPAQAAQQAVADDNLELLRVLLDGGVPPKPLLPHAAERGGLPVFQMLAEKIPAEELNAPLQLAQAAGNAEVVRWLEVRVGDPNEVVNERGETRLHQALCRHDADELQRWLSAGADPNRLSAHGFSPLHNTVIGRPECWNGRDYYPDLALTRMLLEAGADPNLRSAAQIGGDASAAAGLRLKSPLLIAIWNGRVEEFRLMLEHGGDPTLTDGGYPRGDARKNAEAAARQFPRQAAEIIQILDARPDAAGQ